MVQKKRRNVNKNGCVGDFKGGWGNMKLRDGRIEEIDWLKSRIVSLKEPQSWGRIESECGARVRIVISCGRPARFSPRRENSTSSLTL